MYLFPILLIAFLCGTYLVISSDLANLALFMGKTDFITVLLVHNVLSLVLAFILSVVLIGLFYKAVSKFFRKLPDRYNRNWRAGHYNSMIRIDLQHNQL